MTVNNKATIHIIGLNLLLSIVSKIPEKVVSKITALINFINFEGFVHITDVAEKIINDSAENAKHFWIVLSKIIILKLSNNNKVISTIINKETVFCINLFIYITYCKIFATIINYSRIYINKKEDIIKKVNSYI